SSSSSSSAAFAGATVIQPSASFVLVVLRTADIKVVLPTPAGPVTTTAESDVVSASLQLVAISVWVGVEYTAASCAMPLSNSAFLSPKCAWYMSAALCAVRMIGPVVCGVG